MQSALQPLGNIHSMIGSGCIAMYKYSSYVGESHSYPSHSTNGCIPQNKLWHSCGGDYNVCYGMAEP